MVCCIRSNADALRTPRSRSQGASSSTPARRTARRACQPHSSSNEPLVGDLHRTFERGKDRYQMLSQSADQL
jgi:hypothetical protein